MPNGSTDDNAGAFASDPAWADLLTWDKNLIDSYGYDNLTRWEAGAGEEFSASNAFETGKVAMILDGEYRTAFIKAEHPELNYGTAPLPVPDDQQDRYGTGYITGSIMGIPKGSSNEAAAWELVKYMTTNTGALVKLANGLANVPTTAASAKSPDLHLGPRVQAVRRHIPEPEQRDQPAEGIGSGLPGDLRVLHLEVAGRPSRRSAVRARGRRQAGRRPGAERVGRSGAVIAALKR